MKTCSIEKCGQRVKARNWCWKHYQRWRRHGSPNKVIQTRNEGRACKVSLCTKPARSFRMCDAHYRRFKRHGDVQSHKPLRAGRGRCSVQDCTQLHKAKGFCIRHYQKYLYHNNIQRKMGLNLRRRLNIALKEDRGVASAITLLGCDLEQFKKHIEDQFEDNMAWDNWGTGGWELDHMRPLNTFDLTDTQQLAEACHYTNIRPMWASENRGRPKDGSDLDIDK